MKRSICSLLVLVAACGADDTARAPSKVSEIETTVQQGSTTVDRLAISYDGSRIREIAAFHNGAPDGRATVMYMSDAIARIDFADAQGDRAQQQFTYTGGQLVGTRYEVTGVSAHDRTLRYESGRLDEISETRTLNGSSPTTMLVRFEYDPDGRTTKQLTVRGSSTDSTEMRYAPDDRLERTTMYRDNSHVETYAFTYAANGKLDEITDTRSGRHTITYDTDGRISEIRSYAGSALTTTRYTYVEGHIDGMTFAPALPVADLFDLTGGGYATISPLHWVPEIPEDIAKATPGDDDDGDGGQTCGFTPQDSCDQCLAASCCTETQACLTGTACYQYYECATACTTQTCMDTCREVNPPGYDSFSSFRTCAQAYCPTTCQ